MKLHVAAALLVLLLPAAARAAPDALLRLPDFEALSQKASESISITLDASLLAMASRFLDADDPQDAAAREVIGGLKGVYVKSYKFDEEFAYPKSDIDAVRKQLSAPGWKRLVEVRSRREQAAVDIYISSSGNKANGLAIIASEPRQFTIVNIVGAIELDRLHSLEGQFGIPELELESDRKAAQ